MGADSWAKRASGLLVPRLNFATPTPHPHPCPNCCERNDVECVKVKWSDVADDGCNTGQCLCYNELVFYVPMAVVGESDDWAGYCHADNADALGGSFPCTDAVEIYANLTEDGDGEWDFIIRLRTNVAATVITWKQHYTTRPNYEAWSDEAIPYDSDTGGDCDWSSSSALISGTQYTEEECPCDTDYCPYCDQVVGGVSQPLEWMITMEGWENVEDILCSCENLNDSWVAGRYMSVCSWTIYPFSAACAGGGTLALARLAGPNIWKLWMGSQGNILTFTTAIVSTCGDDCWATIDFGNPISATGFWTSYCTEADILTEVTATAEPVAL